MISKFQFFGACSLTASNFYKIYKRVNAPILETPASEEFSVKVNADAKKVGITESIKVYQSEEGSYFTGLNVSGIFNNMSITIQKGDEEPFTIAHELGHAKANDCLYFNALDSLTPLPFFLYFKNVKAACLLYATIYLSKFYYTNQAEKRADLFAAQHCNNEEINDFINELTTEQKRIIEYRNTKGDRLFKTMFTPSGDRRSFLYHVHPTHSTRIDYLNRFMKVRDETDPTPTQQKK